MNRAGGTAWSRLCPSQATTAVIRAMTPAALQRKIENALAGGYRVGECVDDPAAQGDHGERCEEDQNDGHGVPLTIG